jgi:rhamnogalacturonan endolyase
MFDSSFTYTIDALNAPTSFSAADLPPGLTLDATTGVISGTPTAAGTYSVTLGATNAAGDGNQTLTIQIDPAPVVITFPAGSTPFSAAVNAAYDGGPLSVSGTTSPAGVPVTITYNGSTTAPTLPGTYHVVITSNDSNYAGSVEGTFVITSTALVRHAPTLNGDLDGSLQLIGGESFAINGSGSISSDLLVPGTPTVKLNGHPLFAGIVDAAGAVTPTNYTVTLNGGAVSRYLVRRVDPLAMPVVTAPAAPAGTRDVNLNKASDTAGDFATIRNLTLNGNAGTRAVPAGVYGNITINGNSSVVLGVAGATEPSVYELQGLTLNGRASVQIVGPVKLKLANGTSVNGTIGSAGHPGWLEIELASGGLTLNGQATVHAIVTAPNGTVTVNGTLHGRVTADRLTINGQGVLEDATP